MRGSCYREHSPREDNNSIWSRPVREYKVCTGVTATGTRSVAGIPNYTSVTPDKSGVFLSQGGLAGQSLVSLTSVSRGTFRPR